MLKLGQKPLTLLRLLIPTVKARSPQEHTALEP